MGQNVGKGNTLRNQQGSRKPSYSYTAVASGARSRAETNPNVPEKPLLSLFLSMLWSVPSLPPVLFLFAAGEVEVGAGRGRL